MGRVDILTGTLGKALGGASGGYTSARKEIVDLLRQRSRPYLFSNSVAPAIVGASLKVLDLLARTRNCGSVSIRTRDSFVSGCSGRGFNIAGRAPHRAGDAGRRLARNENGRAPTGEGSVRRWLFLSRGPARKRRASACSSRPRIRAKTWSLRSSSLPRLSGSFPRFKNEPARPNVIGASHWRHRQIYGERHPRVADVLINLGAIRFDLGHYAEAERYDRQALDIAQGWYGKDNPETATDLTILARALIHQNRLNEANDLLEQSLEIKERAFGKVHPSVASTLNELGAVALQEDKYDAAEQYFKRMADIYRAVYGEHHYLLGTALSNMGSVYSAQHQWSRAEQLYRQAIPIYTQALSPTDINVGTARIKLGRAILRQHRYQEAETETRAGYDILITQMDPKVNWLVNARKDLVEEYDALKQPEQAAKIRAEIAAEEAKSPEIPVRK